VGRLPQDPDERLAWLERWGAEQHRRQRQRELEHATPHEPDPERPRLPARVAQIIEAQVDRLETYADRVFDRGLDTSGTVTDIPELDTVEGNHYAPSTWHILPRALRAIGASDRDVLIDFGCGKGRIVHQAAKWPLKRVIGVEVSPRLAGVARDLVADHRHEYRCQNVEIAVCDVARFLVPDDLTIAYLFDPFRGETLDAVLRNLIESIDRRPRRVWLIYVHPVCGADVLATGRFRLVRWQRGGLRDIRFNRAAIFEARG
jgi:hypothetical protein